MNKDSNLQARIKQLDRNKAVVGGQEADINSIPWQVGIMGNCYFRDLKITLNYRVAHMFSLASLGFKTSKRG